MAWKRAVWVSVLLLIFGPVNAYADSIVYGFGVTHVLYEDLDDPTTFTYQTGAFSLPHGRLPDFVSIDNSFPQNPMFENMAFYNVPYTMTSTKNGVLLSQSSGVGTVIFWFDGIELPNGFHVYDAPLSFDWHHLSPPEFQPGHYVSSTIIQYYDVVAETPEPSTLMLIGSGVLGGVAVWRRKAFPTRAEAPCVAALR
jgi:hypothetical protein